MAKIYFETYGCANNQAESQIMAGVLDRSGHTVVSRLEDSDIIIVNTCSVKSTTEQKTLHSLQTLQKKYPNKKFIIGGCMPEAEYDVVKKHAPRASLLNTHYISSIDKIVSSTISGEQVELLGKQHKEEKVGLPQIASQQTVHIVPIPNGCMSACTFCSTKLAKGGLFSYAADHIVSDVSQAKDAGASEFWLTSQDCGCYGFDVKTSLASLVKQVATTVRGKYFIRVGMANPQHVVKILPQLLEAYRNDHVFKFIHIPVQSGSERILRSMKRGHTVADFVTAVRAFRETFPNMMVWTDMIVGFPGETEEDFQASMKLIEEVQPDYVNMSTYSVRPNTPAARMKQVPTEIKKERTRSMSLLVKRISLERNKHWDGWVGPVLIDEYHATKKTWIARNPFYKTVVLSGSYKLGDIRTVKIIAAERNHLVGQEISV